MKTCLDPIIDSQSRVVILGTLPGGESLRLAQYYADPANGFWRMLDAAFEETIGESYAARVDFLKAKGLALWDVLRSADRLGSVDVSIRDGVANVFASLFARHRSLTTVVFNGSKAERLFRSLVWAALVRTVDGLCLVRVASSSSTPGRYVPPFPVKVALWKAALRVTGTSGRYQGGSAATQPAHAQDR